jgi:GNAT superfamily N-acetyltransferase
MTAVRKVESGDRDRWLELWRGYQDFYEVDIPAETARVTWARLLDPKEAMFGALAIEDGRPIGLVHWLTHRSCWTIGDYCYLQDLFVARDRRGTGAGRSLIEYVYADAKARGCPRVYWLTHETNHTARLLYDRVAERTGFIQYRKTLT